MGLPIRQRHRASRCRTRRKACRHNHPQHFCSGERLQRTNCS
jgi:hypothetical protein